MKVIHSVDEYLPVTQHWVYQQITGVPGVQAAVICRAYSEPEEFPVDRRALFYEGKSFGKGGPNVVMRIARKLGLRVARTEKQAQQWLPDLIHAHFGTRGWEMLRLARRANCHLL